MLGNSLIDFFTGDTQKQDWLTSLSDVDKKKYKGYIKQYNKKHNRKDFNVDTTFKSLNEDAKTYFNSLGKGKASIEGLNKAMSKTMQVTTSSGEAFVSSGNKIKDLGSVIKNSAISGLKGFGKALLGSGLNMLINGAIGAVIEGGITLATKAYEELAHEQERVIEKGKEASQKIQENYSSIVSNEQWKNTNLERFSELAKGVSNAGKNISLTSDEFAEYQSLAANLAEIMPNLVLGFNDLGEPIIKAATNMDTLNTAFRDNEIKKYKENIKNTTDVLKAFQTQYDEEGTVFKESGLKQKLAAYKDITSLYNEIKAENPTDWQGNKLLNDRLRTSDKDGYNFNTIKDIAEERGIKMDEFYENIDVILEGEEIARQEMGIVANSIKNVLPSFLKIRDDYYGLITDSPNVDSFMQSLIYGLDNETLVNSLGSEKQMKAWAKNVSSGLQKAEVQEAIEGLYVIDEKKADMSFKEYNEKVQAFAKTIGDNVKGIDDKQVLKGFDLDEEFADLSTNYEKIAKNIGEDFANSLSVSDLEIASDIISEQEIYDAKELSQAIKEIKLGEDAKSSFEAFSSSITEATANLESLKSTLSESVSGAGISSENLQAFRTMFGDNAEKALERTANGYHINQKALAELQEQQNEALKTDYLSSLNKQYDQLRKVNEDLAKTAIMGGDVSGLLTQKAGIEAQIESLKDLQYQYEAANSAYQKWVNAQAGANERNMYENIQAGYEGVKDLIERGWVDDDVRTYVDLLSSADLSTANAEEVIEAYSQLGKTIGNSGYSILDFFTVDENGKSTTDGIYNFFDTVKSILGEEYASFEDGKYKFNFGEGRDQEVAKALGMDVEAVQSILRAASEAGFEIHLDQPVESLEELKTSAETAKETLSGLNDTSLSDIDLDSTSLEDVDNQIQKVQEHISSLDPNIQTEELEAANDILEYLVQKKEELSKTTDIQFNLNNEEVLEKLSNANEKLKELGKTDVTFDFEANVDEIDSQVEKATSLLEQFKNEDGTVDLSIEGAQEAVDILQALLTRKEQLNQPAVMKVDSSQVEGDLGSAIGKIQEFQQAINDLNIAQDLKNAGVDIDTSAAQAKVQELAGDIQGLDGNVKASLGLNTEEFNSAIEAVKSQSIDVNAGLNPTSVTTISSALAGITPEIMVKAGVDPTLVDSYSPTDKDGKVTYHVNSEEVDAWTAPKKEATLTYNITTSGSLPGDKERTLTYKIKTEGTVGVNGTAHVNGTSGNANASGNWGVKKGGTSLVGELGTEILVRGSEFHTIGDNGAEFIETKPGDIIFNHKQTEALLENGYVTGRGKLIGGNAHVDGTAYSHGSGGLGRPSRPYPGMGSSSSNKDKNTSSSKKPSSKKKSSDSSSSASDEAKEFEETLDWIEIKIDRLERKIKSLDRIAGSAFETYATRSKALAEQMGEVSNEITVQQQAYERYLQQANSISLSDDYKTQVQNGTIDISTITDEDLKKNIDDYKQWYEKALDCKDAVEELTESVKELYQQAFDNIVEEFDNYISLIEHNKNIIDGYIEQDENAGYLVSTKYYDSLIALENQTLNQLTEERNRLIASLNEAVSSGNVKEYSDAWFKMQQDINDVNEAIQDSTSSLIDYKNAIQEIQWDIFDKIQDRISDINKESDFLIELMSNDKLFDDKGKITDKGKATMGLHGVNYNTYMAQADDYRKEMEKIQKELAEDPHNQTLIDRKRELLDLQREAIQSAEDEKEAIKDLVEEGIEKQLDSLQELIDKYNDTLDSQKDLYDYQKEIAEKQKEIAEIEKQLAAYKGDNSEEGAAKRQELENALAESKDELAETQYEKSISEQKKLLDELYTEYETILNMRLDNIDILISDVIANVNSESSGIKDTITSEADKVGYTITDSMNTIWGSNGISGVLTNYSNNFSSTMTGVMTAINDIKNLISKAIEASNNKSQSNISQSQNNQSQQGVEKPSPPPTPPKPTSPQGDGTPNMGDKVTFVSGNYYYDSYGTKPLGHQYRGKEVYITKINPKGSKPYHISRGNKLGDGDLGWVNLEQIKGYKTGVKSVPKNGLYWTNEGAPETIVRKKDNALLTKLNLGDTVLKNSSHNHIWEMANNPTDFIGKYMPKFSPTIPSKYVTTGNNPTEIQINIGIEKVQDYNDFVRQLQADNKFEKLVQSMTIDRIAGKGKLNKYGIKI